MARKGSAPSMEEARQIAELIASVDGRGRDAMRAFLDGGITVAGFLPYLRREAGAVLDDESRSRRLGTGKRLELATWVATWGRSRSDGEPFTISAATTVSLSQWEELKQAAEKAGIGPAEFMRLAVAEKAARVLGDERKGVVIR